MVIIGAGVVGLCCAYYARLQGFEVTVVERNGPEYEGCSFGNAGMIVPSHFVPLAAPGVVMQGLRWMLNPESPFYVKPRLRGDLLAWAYRFWCFSNEAHVRCVAPLLRDLNVASLKTYEELAECLSDPFYFAQKGLLMMCHSQQGFEEEIKLAELANWIGVRAEVLDGEGVRGLEPHLTLNLTGAVYFPDDANLNPNLLMHHLRQWLLSHGVKLKWHTKVEDIHTQGSQISHLTTNQGDLEADQLVLCAGIWSSDLAKKLKLNLPMQAGKGYSMTLKNPPQEVSTPAILTEARVAVSPLGEGMVRFGGTMELAGIDERVNATRVEGIIKSVLRYFPDYQRQDFADQAVWYGFRPCSPDGLPYIGQSQSYQNLFIATGHAMMGLSLAPITGKLMSQLLTKQKPDLDILALSPERFKNF